MRFAQFAKAIAPVAVIAITAALSGCDGKNVHFDSDGGVPLAQLDLSGAAPHEITLAGPDNVTITTGDKLAINVTGDAADKLRFKIDGDSLLVSRKDGLFSKDNGVAAVAITMPAPKEVTLAGSGKITAPQLARQAQITIAGSGDVDATAIDADTLKLMIAGSGNFHGAGNTAKFDLTVAGSGSAATDALRVDTAKVTIAGSGDAAFSSDGTVEATIMGSGEVRVKGRAHCTVSAMGSGKLVCEPGDGQGVKTAKDAPPSPPSAPAAPEPPETDG